MIDESDLRTMYAGAIEKSAASGTLVGALGGAGLGALMQYLRPKDKDQNSLKEYLFSALTGATLGGLGGFAYDNLSSNKFDVNGKQRNSSIPTKKFVPLPSKYKLDKDTQIHAYQTKDPEKHQKWIDDYLNNPENTKPLQTLEGLYTSGMQLADNGGIADDVIFLTYPELIPALFDKNNPLFGESKTQRFREHAEHLMPAVKHGNSIYPVYMDPNSHYLKPDIDDGPLFTADESVWKTILRSLAYTTGMR